MPLFDFLCQKCSHVFEFERPFGSKAHPACPACRSRKTEKLMTPPAIQFKGSGFYKTDSRVKPVDTHPKAKKSEPSADKKEQPKGSTEKPAANQGASLSG